MLELTDDELSALVEACKVTNRVATSGHTVYGYWTQPSPPWDQAGRAAWDKLICEEARRGRER